MIKLIQSKRLKIPVVYLVENNDDLKELPLGVPFIRADRKEYYKCVQMLEWETLWQSAVATGLPFDWEKILRENGFRTHKYGIATSSKGDLFTDGDLSKGGDLSYTGITIDASEFMNDISYKVDIEVLKNLKLIPVWLDDIEKAVKENITNTVTYNSALYTKKLDLPLGDFEYTPGAKNVIIIDISSSIPKSISSTMLALAKTLAEQFYADIVLTGSKSVLYEYEKIDQLDVDNAYSEIGRGNEQEYFRALLEEPREYKTAIAFGDDHQPGNFGSITISEKQGKELCKWKVDDVISFHTTSTTDIAGYARWFDTNKITYMSGWVHDLN